MWGLKPIPLFLPGESHGQRSLVGCSPWGHTELDMTEATWQQQQWGLGFQKFTKKKYTGDTALSFLVLKLNGRFMGKGNGNSKYSDTQWVGFPYQSVPEFSVDTSCVSCSLIYSDALPRVNANPRDKGPDH